MTPRVFVSHKQEDSERTALIAARLRMGGLVVYLDVIDAQLDKAVRTSPTIKGCAAKNACNCSR
ncbi:hypothetical protein MBRA_00957 [Methylobacterium brachiatum]|nr:hypothetical protein MBRA_00957 [Methylobacterium brachiatum]